MSNWNLRTIYLAIPLALGLSSCSVTKEITHNMVLVNSPKDLEYKVNVGNVTAERDISVRTQQKETQVNATAKPYSEIRFIPYKPATSTNSYMPNYSVPLLPKK
jgi:hypothetical protein